MVLGPMEMEDIRLEVNTIKQEDLELRKREVLVELSHEKMINPSSKKFDALAEILTWIDARLEGIPDTGMKAWWFRAKRRAKYLK